MADAAKHRTGAIPPSADPTEAIERIVSRRQLKIQDGDVVLARLHGAAIRPELFELRIVGIGTAPERFATFGHAAARGEILATERRSRLFFMESETDLPSLLKDSGQ